MKTKLLLSYFLILSGFLFSQAQKDAAKNDQKFYFPASAFSNTKDFDKNFTVLLNKIAPMEIDEKKQEFSRDAEIVYLMQKNYKGLENYGKNEKFPKESLPLKNYAEAMIADPAQGNLFKKTFTENFAKDFKNLDEKTKTAIGSGYFDLKMIDEYQKMDTDFIEQLSKNKSDSITYKDAKKLLYAESLKLITKTITPLGKEVVKGYVLEYFQPYLTGNLWLSVVKPKEVNDLPDPSKEYKLVFEIVNFSRKDNKETAFQEENSLLVEAARIINLHIASGIAPEKLKAVLVIHGGATKFLFNDLMYKDNFKIANPNLPLIKQMQNKGIKFVVCGQYMTWEGLKLGDLTKNIQEAFSAKTALSNYQNQGYIYYKLENEN